MTPETEKALQASIDEKWKPIARGGKADGGTEDCPLCALFFNWGCSGCPVSKRTGFPFCSASPYLAWLAVFAGRESRLANTPERVALAEDMVKFLKSLLPEEGGEK